MQPAPPSPLDLNSALLAPAPHVVSRVIQERALVLDHTRDELRQLNEVGSLLWASLQEAPLSIEDLTGRVVERFEVEREEARADVIAFARELLELELITLR